MKAGCNDSIFRMIVQHVCYPKNLMEWPMVHRGDLARFTLFHGYCFLPVLLHEIPLLKVVLLIFEAEKRSRFYEGTHVLANNWAK